MKHEEYPRSGIAECLGARIPAGDLPLTDQAGARGTACGLNRQSGRVNTVVADVPPAGAAKGWLDQAGPSKPATLLQRGFFHHERPGRLLD